uniref:Macrophage migration inhibitory factor n=1 Tax=Branchiostoma belcheri tsingtauense TaxID=155462 RepID=Q698K0_BRABE|nr:macrophage migration inhibitory factor II [Branchiostoma belcheri tsingtauense]
MPSFVLKTNLARSAIPKDFLTETSKLVADILGKPEGCVCVCVEADVLMTYGGSDAPCCLIDLMSIGKLGLEENKTHTAAICDHVKKHLGIPGDRLYVNFHDAARQDVGRDGTTFAR